MLDKAVRILDLLAGGPLRLVDIADQAGISRPTAHRLCAALESHGLIAREGGGDGGLRSIGPKALQWAGIAAPLEDRLVLAAGPVLEQLRDATGESVQLYVRDGGQRRCIAGLESPHGLRTIVEVGALLPLALGSAGAALRAASPGWVQSVEERERGVASVSAPVLSAGSVIAAVSVSGPIDRTGREPGERYGSHVTSAAERIGAAL